jgi:colanic acid/amylovoran biosynthesis glycosyltransferase
MTTAAESNPNPYPRQADRAESWRRAAPRRIAYIVSRFPAATETFLLREFDRVDRDPEVEVELFSLFPGDQSSLHPSGEPWMRNLHRGRILDVVAGVAWWGVRRPARLLGAAAWVTKVHAARPMILVRALVTVGLAAAHARRIARLRVDHVHACWATYPALAAWVSWRLTDIPYSFTGHAHDLFINQLGLERKLRDARFVVTISEHNRRFLSAIGGDKRVHVVHYGIDLSAYRFRPRGPAPSGTVRALCVASFYEYKGHRVLVEALAAGGQQVDRVEVALVGEGPLRLEVEDLATRLGVRHRLHFLGHLPEQEVAKCLDEADIVVLPSVVARNGDTEGIPNALIEAMAAGVPVVSTRVSGIPELVREGVTGLLVAPGDAAGLRDAIERTIADPRAAEARAVEGRRVVEQEFDIESVTSRLIRLFREGTS